MRWFDSIFRRCLCSPESRLILIARDCKELLDFIKKNIFFFPQCIHSNSTFVQYMCGGANNKYVSIVLCVFALLQTAI